MIAGSTGSMPPATWSRDSASAAHYADQLACEVGEFASLPAIKQFLVDDIPVVVPSRNSGNKSALKAPADPGRDSVGDNPVRRRLPETVNPSSSSAPFLTLLAPGTQQPDPAAPGGRPDRRDVVVAERHLRHDGRHLDGGAARGRGARGAALGAPETRQPSDTPWCAQADRCAVHRRERRHRPRIRLLSALVSLGDTGFEMSWAKVLPGGKLFSNGASARTMAKSPAMITISGIPAGDVVKSAHLYFMTAGAADSDASMSINGSLVAGTLLGAWAAPHRGRRRRRSRLPRRRDRVRLGQRELLRQRDHPPQHGRSPWSSSPGRTEHDAEEARP